MRAMSLDRSLGERQKYAPYRRKRSNTQEDKVVGAVQSAQSSPTKSSCAVTLRTPWATWTASKRDRNELPAAAESARRFFRQEHPRKAPFSGPGSPARPNACTATLLAGRSPGDVAAAAPVRTEYCRPLRRPEDSSQPYHVPIAAARAFQRTPRGAGLKEETRARVRNRFSKACNSKVELLAGCQ
jgi:hypothetical protein